MGVYSFLLLLVLVVGAPYWVVRMMTSGRYRAGLAGRLGRVPPDLRTAVAGREVVWVHAVSVGEVMAAGRLVQELREALPGWVVVVSTTTETGQRLAKERLAGSGETGSPVFYLPLDFRVVVRRYLEVVRPKLVVMMESELWPRLIEECAREGIPMAVVNARVSDRSFPRYMRLRGLWRPLLEKVSLFLAQSGETAERLVKMSARAERVRVTGNLKYDVRAPKQSRVAELIREAAAGRPIVVAGSTVSGPRDKDPDEEISVIQAWEQGARQEFGALLVLAPRHPDRFREIEALVMEFEYVRARDWGNELGSSISGEQGVKRRANNFLPGREDQLDVVLLDTIGDLAAVYGVADVAFVGGSLVAKGGHNPLEPAQFGVPVVMGGSYENFKEIVGAMKEAGAIRITDRQELSSTLTELLQNREAALAMGERGRAVFEGQSGATGRTVQALLELLPARGR